MSINRRPSLWGLTEVEVRQLVRFAATTLHAMNVAVADDFPPSHMMHIDPITAAIAEMTTPEVYELRLLVDEASGPIIQAEQDDQRETDR